jgi:hypothetical protein
MGITRRNKKLGNPSRNPRKKRVPASEKGKQRPPLPPGVKLSQVQWDPYLGRYVRNPYARTWEQDGDSASDERAA